LKKTTTPIDTCLIMFIMKGSWSQYRGGLSVRFNFRSGYNMVLSVIGERTI